MKPISINYVEDPYFVAHDVFEVVRALDRIRQLSTERPIIASVGMEDDPDTTVLEIGVNRDVGFARFLIEDREIWAPGLDSSRTDTAMYYFQEDDVEIPARFEAPFDLVQLAVVEYMVHEGRQPAVVTVTDAYM